MILLIISIIVIALIAVDSNKNRIKPAAMTAKQPQEASQTRQEEKRQRAEEQRRQKVAQAQQDLPFYETQLERLYPTAEALRYNYKLACDSVLHDAEMNMYGAVIKDKLVNEHIAQRDKLLKKLIIAENQIHALEKKIQAAQAILSI